MVEVARWVLVHAAYSSNMRVPIDDDSCYMYRFRWRYEPFTEKQRQTDL